MTSTREKILRTLLSFPNSTINDLADEVGINGISIRHHLIALEAEGVVSSTEERHGVGRPRLIYALTEKGIERFPTSYFRLTKYLIEALKERMSPMELQSFFSDIGKQIGVNYDINLDDPLEKRLKLLKAALSKEGFIIELKNNKNGYTLTTLSCPYYKVGIMHPEVCEIDSSLISEFVKEPLTNQSCIFKGDDRCSFYITKES